LGITTIYVTHDQSEALALSHEIAVMRSGRIMQIGTPREIYEKPNSEFVADFVGTINFIKATVRSIDAAAHAMVVDSEMGTLQVPMVNECHVGEAVQICIRPEDVYLSDSTPPVNHTNHYLGTVFAKIFLGEVLDFQVQVNEKVILARVHPSQKTPVGAPIHIVLDPSDCIVLKNQN
ncbi:MAG: Spermidine/putrescine import ATP-binding protein PotA, partial [Pseudomonadota bacterium]